MRDRPPDHTVYNLYKRGDVIFGENVKSGGPLGWVCTNRDAHLRVPAGPTYRAAVSVVAGSNEVTVIAPKQMRQFVPGLAIALVGAGMGGAPLDTFITEASGERPAFTVNDMPAMTLAATDVKVAAPLFEPFGIAGGVAASRQPDSRAKDIEGLVRDFNALLAHLRKAKLLKE